MKTRVATVAIGILVCVIGCAHYNDNVLLYAPIKGVYQPINSLTVDLRSDLPLVLMDKSLGDTIEIVQTSKTLTTPAQLLNVQGTFFNRTKNRLELQVSCVFKDELGGLTSDETAWSTLIIPEHGEGSVSFVAMNKESKAATIRVREVR